MRAGGDNQRRIFGNIKARPQLGGQIAFGFIEILIEFDVACDANLRAARTQTEQTLHIRARLHQSQINVMQHAPHRFRN